MGGTASHMILIEFYGQRTVNAARPERSFRSLNVETFPIVSGTKRQPESFMRAIPHVSRALAIMLMLATASVAFAADGDDWTVHKSSGEVWLAGSGVQQASLKQEDVLKPGDTIRTGRTGRV